MQARAKSTFCSVTRSERFSVRRTLAISRARSSTMSGARPSAGSSSMSSFGRGTSPRPTATICCWPPDKRSPRRSRMGLRRGNRSATSSGERGAVPRGQAWRARERFSATVTCGKMRRSSGTRASPSLARWWVGSAPRGRPSKAIAPAARGPAPRSAFSKVDLPAPLRPRRATPSPARISILTPWRIWLSP